MPCSFLSCLVLSCPVLSHSVLLVSSQILCQSLALVWSCPILLCLVLSHPVLYCLVPSCLVLSHPVLSCPILSCPIPSCLVPSCLVLSHPVLSCCLPGECKCFTNWLEEPTGWLERVSQGTGLVLPCFVSLFCLVQSHLRGAVIRGSIVWTSDWSYTHQLIRQLCEVLCNSVRLL